MAILPIVRVPDPLLKKISKPVNKVDDKLRSFMDDMLETMYDAPGIGLAAPQVGVMSRMFVMDCVKEEGDAPQPMVIINPDVLWLSEDLSTYEEGCLSIPEQFGDVERPASIEMQWLGLDGQTHQQRFNGLWATCVQHELDHLNGKLFIDYLKPMRRQMITRKMAKLKREQARP